MRLARLSLAPKMDGSWVIFATGFTVRVHATVAQRVASNVAPAPWVENLLQSRPKPTS